MLWLCLHFSKLPLEIFTRQQTNTQSSTSIIAENDRVLMCNHQAHQQGIDSGMTVDTAHALAENLQTIGRDHGKELDALTELADWAYRYTPSVSVESPNDLLLELSPALKLNKGLDDIINDINSRLSNMGYSCQIGLAHTPKAAWLMSRARPGQYHRYFDVSNSTIDKNWLKKQLEKIPVNLINCSQQKKDQLEQLGLHHIGDLFDLSINAINKHFGKEFLHYIAKLRGNINDPRLFIKPPINFHRSIWFSGEINNNSLENPIESISLQCKSFTQVEQQKETMLINEVKCKPKKSMPLIDKSADNLGNKTLEHLVVNNEYLPTKTSMATRLPDSIVQQRRETANQQLDLNLNGPKPQWLLVDVNKANKRKPAFER